MISIFLFSVLLFYFANRRYLGLVFKKLVISKNILEIILVLFIIYSINILLYHTILNILSYDFSFYSLDMAGNQSVPTTNPNSQDSVRWWPSGIGQTWAVLGGACLLYRTVPGSPRVKAIAALGSLGVSIPTMVLNPAIENTNRIDEAIKNTAIEAHYLLLQINFLIMVVNL